MANSLEFFGKIVLYFLAVIQVHIILYRKSVSAGKVNPSNNAAACTSSTQKQQQGTCPFQATKAFMGRCAFLCNNMNTFKLPFMDKTSTASNSGLKPLTMKQTTQALSFLTSKDVVSNVNLESFQTQASRVNTALYASTISDVEQKSETDAKKPKKKTTGNLEVLVIGLSHHKASVDIREKLAIPEDEWNKASSELCELPAVNEASVLSTCNRFEIYLAGANQYECIRDALTYLEQRAGGALDQETLRSNMFMLSGEEAIWHLLRVSAGLDSLIVGEGQILSQVKRSYERGIEPESGRAGKVVSRMLNSAVTAGKRVRAETGISKGAVSISSAAAEFTAMKLSADCNVDSMERAAITIIGAGKMARLLIVHLQTQDVKTITVVNRSPDRVNELQKEFPDVQIKYEPMDRMWDVIGASDVVYPSTASMTTIIDPEPLATCMSKRQKRNGIQFVDISVPRNVHPGCSAVENVHSYNVDDLKLVVERNTARRRREMIEAEVILKEELAKFRLWQQSLGAIPTINRLQEKAESLRLEEVQKASKKLSNLSAKDLEAVDRLSKGIVAKLLHGPMNHLRQQKEGDATRAAIEQLGQAFQLD